MNLNESCGTAAFLAESCPAVAQGLYLLSLKLTLSAYQTLMTCILFQIRNCFFSYTMCGFQFKRKTFFY
jgi:hypothetical protein